MEYQALSALLVDVAGIGTVVAIFFFLVKQSIPPEAQEWYFKARPWLVNASVIAASVGLAFVGAWLNLQAFAPRLAVELVWKGLFSAAVATLEYEFSTNLGR